MQKYTNAVRKEQLDKITAGYSRLKTMIYVLIGFVAAAIAVAFTRQFILVVAILAAMLLYRLTLLKKARTEYQQSLIDATLICSIGSKLDQYELSTKGGTGITREQVRGAGLVPIREGAESCINFYQGIAGPAGRISLSLNDTSYQHFQHAGEKGADVSAGVWMHFALPETSGRTLRLYDRDLLPDDVREEFLAGMPELKKSPADAAGLKEKLYYYSADNTPLSPEFASAADEFFRKAEGKTAVAVNGSTVDIFIKNRVLAPNYPQNVKPDETVLSFDPLPEFRDALSMVKAL